MKEKNKTKVTLVLAGIFFLLLMLISFSWVKNLSEKNTQNNMTKKVLVSPTPVHLGNIKLDTSLQKEIYTAGEQINIIAYADSHSIPVGGYDIVLNYDPKKAKFIDHQNLVESFQSFVSEKDGAVHLTSVKKKEVTPSEVFKNTPLVEFRFKPLRSEPMNFSIAFHHGVTTDSNLLSEDAKDILTDVQGTSIAIGNKLILQKGKEVVLSDKKTSLTLLEVIPLQDRCADCIESAKVLIKKDTQEKTIVFQAGGIAGGVELYKEELGYKIEVEQFNKNSIQLHIAEVE